MNERELWNEIRDLISESQNEICIFDGNESIGYEELKKMNLLSYSTLGVIITYSSGISIDNLAEYYNKLLCIGMNFSDYS